MSKKKIALWMGGLVLAALVAGAGWLVLNRNTACTDKCNVLLVSIDSLRADHMGAYGYKRDTTPNIDALAKKGTLFENYIASSYLTPISEMSVHTGLYPTTHGVMNFDALPANGVTMLAEHLKKEGYSTTAVSSSPEFTMTDSLRSVFSKGFDSYPVKPPISLDDQESGRGNPTVEEVVQSVGVADATTFTWLALGKVHWPLGANVEDKFSDPGYSGPLKQIRLDTSFFLTLFENVMYPSQSRLSPVDTQHIVDQYDNGIYATDAYIGRVIDGLRESGALNKTIIIIQSEHGEALGEHGYYAHYDLYEPQIRVPLIVVDPRVKAGRRSAVLAGSTDVTPTILDLADMDIPSALQGKSLKGIILKESTSFSREAVFSQRVPLWEEASLQPMRNLLQAKGFQPSDPPAFDLAIRTEKWKYIDRKSRNLLTQVSWWSRISGQSVVIPTDELYDLEADPTEQKNVVEQYPDIANDLRRQLDEWYAKVSPKKSSETAAPRQIQPYQ